MLLARLMACQEHTALRTHPPPHRLAWQARVLARRGPPIEPLQTLLPPWSTGRHVRTGGPRGRRSASEGEAGEAKAQALPVPVSSAP